MVFYAGFIVDLVDVSMMGEHDHRLLHIVSL